MKKKQYIIMAALATMAGLASCSNDEEAALVLTDTPMSISAGINNLSTRAGYDSDANLQSGSFGLFLSTTGSDSTETNYAKYNTENMQFTYDNGAWTGTSQLLWKSSNNTVDYIAYMPYDADMTLTSDAAGTEAAPTAYEFTVRDTQIKPDEVKASDLLYYSASSVTQPTDNALPITFKHMLSRLNVALTLGTELKQSGAKFIPTIVILEDVVMNTKINLQAGTLDKPDSETHGIIVLYDAASEKSDDVEYLFQCILVPQTLEFIVHIFGDYTTTDSDGNITTDTKEFRYCSPTYESILSGYQYTLNLKVGRDVVETGNITATPWTTNSTEGDGDLVTE